VNTEAAAYGNIVSITERKRRTKMLRILSSKKKTSFYNKYKNTTQEVLFESEEKNGRIYGYSRNYLRVSVPYHQSLINQKQWVIINKMDADGNLTADLSV